MSNLVYLLATAALVSMQCGLAASALLDPRNAELDNSLQRNPSPMPHRRRLRKFVRILSPPPATATLSPGETLELTCEAMGTPAPVVQWVRNGEVVVDYGQDANELVLIDPSSVAMVVSTLILTAPVGNQKDVYTCVAVSGERKTSASTVVYYNYDDEEGTFLQKLFPAAPRPRIVGYYSTVIQNEGTDLTLPCRAAPGDDVRVMWTRGTQPVVPGNRVKVLPSGDLYISDLRFSEDMAEYMCTVTNMYGSDVATTFLYPSKV